MNGSDLTLLHLQKWFSELPLIMKKLESHNPLKFKLEFEWRKEVPDSLEYMYWNARTAYKIMEGAALNIISAPVINYKVALS